MTEIIIIEGRRLKVEYEDTIEVERIYCGKCDTTHTEINVYRKGNLVAKLGDNITLDGADEIFGGVVVDDNNNILPDPRWVAHLLDKDMNLCMTKNREHYIGICGKVLSKESGCEHDKIIFLTNKGNIPVLDQVEEKRICPDCQKVYNRSKK